MSTSTAREIHATGPAALTQPDVLIRWDGTYTLEKNCPACAAHMTAKDTSESGALEKLNEQLRAHYDEERNRPSIGELKREGEIVAAYYEPSGYYARITVRHRGKTHEVSVWSDGDEQSTSGDDGSDDVDWSDEYDDDPFESVTAAGWIVEEALARDPDARREGASRDMLAALLAIIARDDTPDEVRRIAAAAAKRASGDAYERLLSEARDAAHSGARAA